MQININNFFALLACIKLEWISYKVRKFLAILQRQPGRYIMWENVDKHTWWLSICYLVIEVWASSFQPGQCAAIQITFVTAKVCVRVLFVSSLGIKNVSIVYLTSGNVFDKSKHCCLPLCGWNITYFLCMELEVVFIA